MKVPAFPKTASRISGSSWERSVFEPDDLLSLPNFSVYLRLMVEGEPSKPFSASSRFSDT
jgi:hypothetical protein